MVSADYNTSREAVEKSSYIKIHLAYGFKAVLNKFSFLPQNEIQTIRSVVIKSYNLIYGLFREAIFKKDWVVFLMGKVAVGIRCPMG